jgi:tRNA(adenine34) deaminase
MWDSLAHPWQVCLEEAWTGYCQGTLPIGAAVVSPGGEILSRGRNRILNKERQVPFINDHTLAHAEINALLALDYRGIDPHQCALYTTTEPCPLCMGAFYMSSVRQLYFAARDPFAGSTNLLGTTPYLSRKPIKVCGPESPELEAIIMSMHVEFDLRHGRPLSPNAVFECWEAAVPRGLKLGKAIYQGGDLLRMKEERAIASEAINHLTALYTQWMD